MLATLQPRYALIAAAKFCRRTFILCRYLPIIYLLHDAFTADNIGLFYRYRT